MAGEWSDGSLWTDGSGWADAAVLTEVRQMPGVRRWLFWPTPAAAAGLPLDAYSATLIGAFSSRKLLTAYAGASMRINNGSTATDIGFVSGAYDTSALATHVGGGTGGLDEYYDQSGLGRKIIWQSSGGKFNVRVSGTNQTQGGKICLTASADGVYCSNTFTAYTGATLSAYAVFVPMLTHPYERYALSLVKDGANDYDAASRMGIHHAGGNSLISVERATSAAGPTLTAGTAYVVTVRANGSSVTRAQLHNSGAAFDLAVSSAFDINRFCLGSQSATTSATAAGIKYCEHGVFTGDLSDVSLDAIADEAATHWSAV